MARTPDRAMHVPIGHCPEPLILCLGCPHRGSWRLLEPIGADYCLRALMTTESQICEMRSSDCTVERRDAAAMRPRAAWRCRPSPSAVSGSLPLTQKID